MGSRLLVCLALLSATACAAAPLATAAYACVDPSDATARRWLQDVPCRPPMFHLPPESAARLDAQRAWPSYPARAPGPSDGHAPFWRFPVHPLGPNEAPRHWR